MRSLGADWRGCLTLHGGEKSRGSGGRQLKIRVSDTVNSAFHLHMLCAVLYGRQSNERLFGYWALQSMSLYCYSHCVILFLNRMYKI